MVSHEPCYLIDTSHLCSEGKKSYFQMTRKGQRKNPKFQNFRLSLIIKKRRNRASEWEREREKKKTMRTPPTPWLSAYTLIKKKIGLLEERGLWLPHRGFSSRYKSKVVFDMWQFPTSQADPFLSVQFTKVSVPTLPHQMWVQRKRRQWGRHWGDRGPLGTVKTHTAPVVLVR